MGYLPLKRSLRIRLSEKSESADPSFIQTVNGNKSFFRDVVHYLFMSTYKRCSLSGDGIITLNQQQSEGGLMKKLLSLVTTIALMGFVGMSYAAQAGISPLKASPIQKVKGEVVSVDAIANKLVVKEADKEDTFSVTPLTRIKIGGKVLKLADIKAAQKVTVHYKVTGEDKVAVEIGG